MFLKYCEMFHSIQGEGQTIGKNVVFLRLSGCNYNCSWCDSKFSWGNGKDIHIDEIVKYVKETKANGLVITGGEPMLQLTEIKNLIHLIKKDNFDIHIEIETNGSVFPNETDDLLLFRYVKFNISPKLSNSGVEINHTQIKLNLENFQRYFVDSIFKFVVCVEDDLREIKAYCQNLRHDKVYLMAEGITADKQKKSMQDVIEICKKNGYNFSPRLHVLIWDTKKGV